jgi:chitin synthase
MFELLKVNTMCGVCCVSMKVVVFIDLIATMILPASYVYAMYLVFLVIFEDLPVSIVLLILYAIIMGVQVVVFILRSRWEYLWWFFIYFTIGLPVFYLILPTYSFWNMDDFSWGKTRAVGSSAAANVDDDEEEEADDDRPNETHRGYGKVHSNDPSASIAEESGSDEESDDDDDDDDDSEEDSSDDDSSDDSSSEDSNSQARSGYFSRTSRIR